MNNMAVLTDPRLEDNPIVWCNDFFCDFTGYSREEVLGRNCRFLQGDEREQPQRLRRAVGVPEPIHVTIRNFKKDGTLFYNDLYVSPVHDDDGELAYFIGIQNDVTEREEARQEVREREREIEETAENERERFGMDLHDGLGQSLTGIAFLAKALHDRLAAAGVDHAPEVGRLVDLVEDAIGEARQMARGLNPVDASPEGLGDALRALAEAVCRTYPTLRCEAEVEDIAFADRREARHLYRIAQEAVNNAAKHAEASALTVALRKTDGGVVLEVRDDGRGVPEELLRVGCGSLGCGEEGLEATAAMGTTETRAALARRGMGLYGMRFRAELIGASLTIEPGEGGGTVVRCTLPGGATRKRQHARGGERE